MDKILRTAPLNLDSTAQVKQYLLSIGWQPSEWNKGPDGSRTSPKLTEDSYGSIPEGMGRDIAYRRKCQHRLHTLYGWVNAIRGDGRVPVDFYGFTITYRLRHKLLVNVPNPEADTFFGKEMREVWIASPGRVIVGGDSDSCQLRMLCHELEVRGLANHGFRDALLYGVKENGTDPHSVNAASMSRILKSPFSRQMAKKMLYTYIFGASLPKVQATLQECAPDDITVSRDYAREAVKAFDTVLPQIPALKQVLERELSRRGYLITLDGSRLYMDSPHKALVNLMQGHESCAMREGLIRAAEKSADLGLQMDLLIWYHDEYQFDVREEQAEEARKVLNEALYYPTEVFDLKVPVAGTAKIGPNWASTH